MYWPDISGTKETMMTNNVQSYILVVQARNRESHSTSPNNSPSQSEWTSYVFSFVFTSNLIFLSDR